MANFVPYDSVFMAWLTVSWLHVHGVAWLAVPWLVVHGWLCMATCAMATCAMASCARYETEHNGQLYTIQKCVYGMVDCVMIGCAQRGMAGCAMVGCHGFTWLALPW